MAEDSGAFKTNQRNSAQIGHFVIARERCGKDTSPPEKYGSTARSRAPAAYFVTNSVEALRYSRIGLIRGVRSWPWGHRVPCNPQRPLFKAPAKGGTRDHSPRFSFSVHRDRAVDVDPDLRAWRGGVAAGRARRIRQHAIATGAARTRVRPAERTADTGPAPRRSTRRGESAGQCRRGCRTGRAGSGWDAAGRARGAGRNEGGRRLLAGGDEARDFEARNFETGGGNSGRGNNVHNARYASRDAGFH